MIISLDCLLIYFGNTKYAFFKFGSKTICQFNFFQNLLHGMKIRYYQTQKSSDTPKGYRSLFMSRVF